MIHGSVDTLPHKGHKIMQGKLIRTITKKLSGRILKIFFTEGYIVYSGPRKKYPVTGVVSP